MVVKSKAAAQSLESKLRASGRFAGVGRGEPTKPPSSPYAAIMPSIYEIVSTTLVSTIERRTLTIRVYIRHFGDPPSDADDLLDDIVTETMEDLFGDFTLGGSVRNIEPLGVRAVTGYQQIADTVYRIADITVPVIVDDSATFAP